MYEGSMKPRSSTKYFRKPPKLWVRTPIASGLVPLWSEEVLELMAEEYPRKYKEYQAEREFLRRKGMESKRVAMQVSKSSYKGHPWD